MKDNGRKMKDSGIEWIGKVPDDWETNNIKPLIIANKNIKKGKIDASILSLSINGVVIKKDLSFGMNPTNYDNHKMVSIGDYVICLRDLDGPLLCGISKYEGCLSSLYFVLNLNTKMVDYDFFDYIMKTMDFTRVIDDYSYGMRHAYNIGQFGQLKISYPSIGNQKKIVSILKNKLNNINELIKNEEQQIEKLKEYKQSLITEVVTKGLDKNVEMKDSGVEWIGKIPKDWQLLPIKAKFKSGKGLPITKADLIEEGTKVISYGQIHAKDNISVEINNSLYRYVDNQWLQSNIDCIVKKGDFIFADTSEDVTGSGDFIYVNNDDLVFAGYHCLTLKPIDGNCNNKYLAYLFLSSVWKSQLQSKVCGVKLYSISKKFLMSTSIILPPINEQKEITNFLDGKCKTIEEVIVIKKEKIEKLNEYKKSLIYEYVTGKKEI